MNPIKLLKRKAKVLDSIVRPYAVGKWDYFVVALDCIYCNYILKVPMDEYQKYNFPILKNRYRKYFILQRHRDKFKNVNTLGFTKSKYTFYEYIPDLFVREIIIAPFCGEEAFVDFLKRQQKIVIKPDRGSLGKGLDVVQYTDDQAARKYFKSITAKRPMICEEFIRQHSVLSALNPASVNTIRVASLLQDGEVEILAAVLKTGAGNDAITDNLSLGGIGAQIDIATGIVCTYGRDFNFHSYAYHPTSGVPILGLQIPHWEQAVELIKTAHKRLPQCMFYGWDIAITETGVDIVEANSKPGTRIMQVMDAIPKGQKLIPLIQKDRLKDKRLEYTRELYQRSQKYAPEN